MNNLFLDELSIVMQFCALVDQCKNLGSRGYSIEFCMETMKKFQEFLNNCITDKELKQMINDAVNS